MRTMFTGITRAFHSRATRLTGAALVITALCLGLSIIAAPYAYAATVQQHAGGGNATMAGVNAATIAFREGLEAVLILASLMGSLKRGDALKLRLPLWVGAGLSLVAIVLTWLLAANILNALADFGERLEAVVSLIAVGILLLITNWFFHKVYWTGWIANFHKRKGRLVNAEFGQWIGMVFLGFASIYREGFEVVLLSQAMVLQAGSRATLTGIGLGFLGVVLVGIVVFGLQVKLPYKKMLIVTGILIGWVLFMLVGNTVESLQSVGWLPTHPIGTLQSPAWLTLTLGVFPTWEGIVLQLAAATFVIGSYVLARHQQQKGQVPGQGARAGQGTRGAAALPRKPLEKVSADLSPVQKVAYFTSRLVTAFQSAAMPATEVFVVVEQGQIVERGTHDDLLAQDGLYARLHRELATPGVPRVQARSTALEPPPRIFVSSATPEDEQGMEVTQQIFHDLRVAGAEVVTADATIAREDFVSYLNQELPRCQYFLLVQTPLTRKSLRTQTSLNVAFNLVTQQRVKGVLRLLTVPKERETEQTFWGRSSAYDASEDYMKARDQLLRDLGLFKPQKELVEVVNQSPSVAQTNLRLSALAEIPLPSLLPASQEEPQPMQDDPLSARIESKRSRYRTLAPRPSAQARTIRAAPVQTQSRQMVKRSSPSTGKLTISGDTRVYRSAHLKKRASRYRITEEKELFQPDNQRVSEQRKEPSRGVYWLFPAGVGMLVTLVLVVGGTSFISWWNNYQLNTTYGFPRTWQTNQVVGIDHDSVLHPSHFIFENLNGQVIFIDIPAGDLSKAKNYSVATLHGDNVASVPVTATFEDVNKDGKPDIFIHVGDQTIIYINTGTDFRPQ